MVAHCWSQFHKTSEIHRVQINQLTWARTRLIILLYKIVSNDTTQELSILWYDQICQLVTFPKNWPPFTDCWKKKKYSLTVSPYGILHQVVSRNNRSEYVLWTAKFCSTSKANCWFLFGRGWGIISRLELGSELISERICRNFLSQLHQVSYSSTFLHIKVINFEISILIHTWRYYVLIP